MAIGYGAGRGYIVKASDVNAVYTNNMTIITNGDVLGQYVFEGSHDTGGCGGPDSGVFIQLKDSIAWSKITVQFTLNGTASCWTFMGGGNSNDGSSGGFYGVAGSPPATMSTYPGGNIEFYNESAGDRIFWDVNAFTNTASTMTRKMNACDNAADNFFRYGGTKSFWGTWRRKSSSSGLAGVWAGRSCNTTGVTTKIENIIIW